MAPTLFNFYFNAIVSVCCEQCGDIGVPILYKLEGDRTAKSSLSTVHISESRFADDLTLYNMLLIMEGSLFSLV